MNIAKRGKNYGQVVGWFPAGSLAFNSCRVVQVSDFYPIFYNPSEDYVHQLHCTYEVVYPL